MGARRNGDDLVRGLFLGDEFLNGRERDGDGGPYVGLDAGSFPIGLKYGINGSGEGNANHEVIVNAVTRDRMRAASGGFANDGGPFQILQVVGELLGAGEGLCGGQHVGRFAV
jgi:hypothetical protein